ncbi:MAG: hypothetical protein ACR9NN_17615 [Nostochopsis sp.]
MVDGFFLQPTINYQQPTINHQQPTINNQQSTINNQQNPHLVFILIRRISPSLLQGGDG